MKNPLSLLTTSQLEILLKSLNPQANNSEGLESSSKATKAFISRLALNKSIDEKKDSDLITWLEKWFQSGGNQLTLSMAIEALIEKSQLTQDFGRKVELVWSGPDWGVGAETRDQSVLIQQMVDKAEIRLLLTTYAFYKGDFITNLFEQIKQRMKDHPKLQVRFVCNINRKYGDTTLPEVLVQKFKASEWPLLWGKEENQPKPQVFFDHRSVELNSMAVCHVKAVVADNELLITSANLTDAAQLRNFELGTKINDKSLAQKTWHHFDQLIQKGMLRQVI